LPVTPEAEKRSFLDPSSSFLFLLPGRTALSILNFVHAGGLDTVSDDSDDSDFDDFNSFRLLLFAQS
jgi:hypothetical protein